MVEAIPEDNSGSQELLVREVSVDAATYEGAVAHLREQVGEGERMITIRVASNS